MKARKKSLYIEEAVFRVPDRYEHIGGVKVRVEKWIAGTDRLVILISQVWEGEDYLWDKKVMLHPTPFNDAECIRVGIQEFDIQVSVNEPLIRQRYQESPEAKRRADEDKIPF